MRTWTPWSRQWRIFHCSRRLTCGGCLRQSADHLEVLGEAPCPDRAGVLGQPGCHVAAGATGPPLGSFVSRSRSCATTLSHRSMSGCATKQGTHPSFSPRVHEMPTSEVPNLIDKAQMWCFRAAGARGGIPQPLAAGRRVWAAALESVHHAALQPAAASGAGGGGARRCPAPAGGPWGRRALQPLQSVPL